MPRSGQTEPALFKGQRPAPPHLPASGRLDGVAGLDLCRAQHLGVWPRAAPDPRRKRLLDQFFGHAGFHAAPGSSAADFGGERCPQRGTLRTGRFQRRRPSLRGNPSVPERHAVCFFGPVPGWRSGRLRALPGSRCVCSWSAFGRIVEKTLTKDPSQCGRKSVARMAKLSHSGSCSGNGSRIGVIY
jgi:hypothetical protein